MEILSLQVYYWKLPPLFLGSKLGSYGGTIDFTLRYSNGSYGLVDEGSPLVIVEVSLIIGGIFECVFKSS